MMRMIMLIGLLLFGGVAQGAVIHLDVEKHSDPSDFGVTFAAVIYKNLVVGLTYYPRMGFAASLSPYMPFHGESFRRTIWVDDDTEINVATSGENFNALYYLYIRDLNENVLVQAGPSRFLSVIYVVPAGLPSKPPAAYVDWPTGVLVGTGEIYVDGAYWGSVVDADSYLVDCDPLPLILNPGEFLEIKGGRTSEAHLYDTDMVLVDSSFVVFASDPDNYLSYLVPGNPGPDPDPSPRSSSGGCGGGVVVALALLLLWRKP